MHRVPLIDITDLYHPPQDPGDNFDLIMPYGLPELDLRAVILDCTEAFRQPYADHPEFPDGRGPRDPGFIPVTQLNYIFGRNVPCAVGPFCVMRSPGDTLDDAPPFQQQGIELILETLRASAEKVEIVSFGSTRALAAAYNRDPGLLRARVERVHIAAGASALPYLEWNVRLDPQAFVRLLRSDLPLALYPCATAEGAFAYGHHNTYWRLPDLRFIADMHPRLRRYLGFALGRVARMDFLRALDDDLPADLMERVYTQAHNVWETAIWAQVARRRLVCRADGQYRLVPEVDMQPADTVLHSGLRPCAVEVADNGLFTFTLSEEPAQVSIYERGDPREDEQALREALPALYQEFLGPM